MSEKKQGCDDQGTQCMSHVPGVAMWEAWRNHSFTKQSYCRYFLCKHKPGCPQFKAYVVLMCQIFSLSMVNNLHKKINEISSDL